MNLTPEKEAMLNEAAKKEFPCDFGDNMDSENTKFNYRQKDRQLGFVLGAKSPEAALLHSKPWNETDIQNIANTLYDKWSVVIAEHVYMTRDLFTLAIQDILPNKQPWISPDTPPEEYKHKMSKDVLTLCGERMIVKCYDYELKCWTGSPHITVNKWQHLPSSNGEAVPMYTEAQMLAFPEFCRKERYMQFKNSKTKRREEQLATKDLLTQFKSKGGK